MKFILGTKEYMTQVFGDDGRAFPATVVKAGPITVTQIKNKEKDGYASLQVGYGERKESRVNKPDRGHAPQKYVREFILPDADLAKFSKGDTVAVDTFAVGDIVHITGTSKGKGFQGVVKRHGFHGGPRSHGQKHSERAPGSIGAGGLQKVFKGMRMGGRMGSDRVLVKNLRVLKIMPESQEMIVHGAVPGRRGTLLEIISNVENHGN